MPDPSEASPAARLVVVLLFCAVVYPVLSILGLWAVNTLLETAVPTTPRTVAAGTVLLFAAHGFKWSR